MIIQNSLIWKELYYKIHLLFWGMSIVPNIKRNIIEVIEK
jgi:hypothetical protein